MSYEKLSLIATTSFGLEALVKKELKDLNYVVHSVTDGKVEFDASTEGMIECNLKLRTAERILLKIGEYKAEDFGQLFDSSKQLDWRKWINPNGKITVSGKCVRSKLMSVRSCQSIIKKSIIESLKLSYPNQSFDEKGDEYHVQISILKDIATITLDTSGAGLHKRGYRLQTGPAPIKETLAAALVMLSQWGKEQILIDPMCGSGTILIEAALMAKQIAPGINRQFAFEQWDFVSQKQVEQQRDSARSQVVDCPSLKLFGYDVDSQCIDYCHENAINAGVFHDVQFQVKDIEDLWIDKPHGCVVSNLPYGIKISSLKELTSLYLIINKMFRKKTDWTVCMLTSDKRFPDFFKRSRPTKVRKLYNGNIETQYYQYFSAK